MRDRHRAVAVVVLVLLASLPALGAAAGQPAASSPDTTTYDLEDLRRGGTQPAGQAPSTRWLDDYSKVWVDYPHANPIRRSDAESWQAQQLLESGTLVRTNTLRFHASGPRNADDRQFELRIVYWQVGQRETPNGTERVATNVSTSTKALTFSGANDVAEVELRSNFGDAYRVTMWLVADGEPVEGARWRFNHHSLRTEQPVATDTAGERMWWVIQEFMLWVLFGGFGMVAAVFALKRRAGRGPGKGMLWWVIVLTFLGGGLLVYSYGSVASLLVDGPQILAGITLALLAIPILEADDADKWLWVRPRLKDGVAASGGTSKDATQFELDSRKVVRMSDGRLAVVESGIRKFLARLFGGVAVLEGVEDMPTESRVVGSTGYDRIAWTRADADQALEYEPEGWQFNLPTDGNGLIKLGIAAVAFAALGQAWIGSTLVGVLALPALALRPKSGSAWFAPANAHQRAAYVSMLYGAVEYEEAETLEESRRKRLESESTNQKDVEQALEKRDATLLEEAVSDVEPELANLGNGHPDHGGDTDSDDVDDQDDSGWLMDLARGVANDD